MPRDVGSGSGRSVTARADAMAIATGRRGGVGDEPLFVTGRRDGNAVRVVLERSGSAVLVRAVGSVDASNAALWRQLIGEAAAITTAPGPLIVDTSALEFMGLCAFAALTEESAGCLRRGVTLCLVSNQRLAGRVVTAAGLDTRMSFCANIDDALSAHGRA